MIKQNFPLLINVGREIEIVSGDFNSDLLRMSQTVMQSQGDSPYANREK